MTTDPTAEGGLNAVSVNLLSNGSYNWKVYVASSSAEIADLMEAKAKAISVCRQLEEELTPNALGVPQKR